MTPILKRLLKVAILLSKEYQIESGLGKIGDKIIHFGQIKTQSFAENLPELASIALISYLIYIGYKSFLTRGIDLENIFAKTYPAFMIYIIFKLFWRVVLKI
jgi:hypothetical protein